MKNNLYWYDADAAAFASSLLDERTDEIANYVEHCAGYLSNPSAQKNLEWAAAAIRQKFKKE